MDSSEMISEFCRRAVRFDSQQFNEWWSRIQKLSSLIIEKPLRLGDWRYLMKVLAEVDVSRIEHLVLELPYHQEAPRWWTDKENIDKLKIDGPVSTTDLELGRVFRSGRFFALKTLRILSSESGQVSGLGQGQSASLAAALKKGKFTNLRTLSLPASDVRQILDALVEGGISQLTSFSIRGLDNSSEITFQKPPSVQITNKSTLQKTQRKPVSEGLDGVLRSGYFKNLETLSLYSGIIEESACWEVFTRAMRFGLLPNIRDLSLSESPLRGFDLADLVRGPSNPFNSLENLSLDSCCITSQQLCTMVDAIISVSDKRGLALKDLDLHGNLMDNNAVSALVKLADSGYLQQLQKLDLNSNSAISSRGALILLGTIEKGNFPKIQSLNWDIKLDDEAAEAITRAYFESQAMTVDLDVDWSRVTDRSLRTKVKEYRERNLRIATLKTELEEDLGDFTSLSRAKVFLCGYPEVGKTKLRKSILRHLGLRTKFKWETRPNLVKEPRTRGIELSRIAEKNHHGAQSELVFWDLAGQEEYLVLHGTFLADLGLGGGKSTTFVLVFKAPFRSEVKEELLFWFRFVASSSFKLVKRHVVIVLNCFDGKQCTEIDRLKWIDLIRSSATLFDELLDICLDPFIMDVRVAAYVKPLKDYLFDHARTLLRDVEVPRVCFELLEELKGWSASKKSNYLPILPWEAFEKGSQLKHKTNPFTGKALKIAASYLHEIGEIIYFKEKNLIDKGSQNKSVVVPDPQWFCKEVVGQLLLPKELMLEGESSVEVHADGSLSIGVFQQFLSKSLVEGITSDDVISMLETLGLCFRKGKDEIIVPALISEDSYKSLDWEDHRFHWVMGRCFAAADRERLAIPVTLFRRLKVELAQDANFGGCSDSEYRAGKSFLNFKVGELLILIQFDVDQSDPTDDRIDVLVKSMLQGDPGEVRLAQIKCICEIMQKLENLCASCCPGMEYDTKIIKPWSASEKTPRMSERRLTSLREMGDRFSKGRQYSSWLLDGNPVELHRFFSASELKDFRQKQNKLFEGIAHANLRSDVPPRVGEVTENPNMSLEIIEESDDLDASVKVITEGVEITKVLLPLRNIQELMMNGETHISWEYLKDKPLELKILLSDGELKALEDQIVASKETAESEYGELMRFVRSAGLLQEDSWKGSKESAGDSSSKVVHLVQERAAFQKQNNDRRGYDEGVISAVEKEGDILQVDRVTEVFGMIEVGEPSERPDVSVEITPEQGLAKMIQECSQSVINAVYREGRLTRQTVRQDGHRTRQLVDKIRMQVLEVQAQQAFSIKDKESSVPRYMFLTRIKGNSSVWISLKGAFRSSFQLHLLCEAHFDDGFLHEVEDQEGIELRRPKKWLVKVSPWLRRSLQVAIMVGKTVGNIYVPGVFNLIPDVNYLESDVEELVRAVDRAATMLEDEDEGPIQVQDDHQEHGTAIRQHIDVKERMIAEQVVEELRVELGRDVFAKKIGLKRVLLITRAQPDEGSSKQAEPSVLWICRECYKNYRASPEVYKIHDISP